MIINKTNRDNPNTGNRKLHSPASITTANQNVNQTPPFDPTTNLNSPTHNQLQHKFPTQLRFCTHNVQGLNNDLKLRLWIEYCNEQNLYIISMTETKLAKTDSTQIRLFNPYFQIYTSNCTETQANVQPSSLGTAIAVKKDL